MVLHYQGFPMMQTKQLNYQQNTEHMHVLDHKMAQSTPVTGGLHPTSRPGSPGAPARPGGPMGPGGPRSPPGPADPGFPISPC